TESMPTRSASFPASVASAVHIRYMVETIAHHQVDIDSEV
ncbi:host-nuclease inhibitor Gam family protein, partial [Escherichia sp. R-CC3]